MVQHINYIDDFQKSTYLDESGKQMERFNGLRVVPQYAIGKFRIDFLVSHTRLQGEERVVLIECDSQAFHDRSETERRYEKQRDRFLQSAGFKIFRFTGAEILSTPFDVAAEILKHVTGFEKLKIQHDPDF